MTTTVAKLWYPGTDSPGSNDYVEIKLVHVRAADSIRVSYDFERDGYRIEQASRSEFDADGNEQDPDWQEVAFVQAWGRETK